MRPPKKRDWVARFNRESEFYPRLWALSYFVVCLRRRKSEANLPSSTLCLFTHTQAKETTNTSMQYPPYFPQLMESRPYLTASSHQETEQPLDENRQFLHLPQTALCELRPSRLVQRSHSEGIINAAQALLSLSPSAPTIKRLPPKKRLSGPGVPLLVMDTTVSPSPHDSPLKLRLQPPVSEPKGYYSGCTSLALPQDEESLSPLHCFMRKYCVEAFTAGPEHISTSRKSQNSRIALQQVGIRCLHCKHADHKQERAVCFPSSLKNIYHSIETWQRRHSLVCRHIPPYIKAEMTRLMQNSRSGAVVRLIME